jgi:hypothetical protein
MSIHTDDEINAEIAALTELKAVVPEHNRFRDSNHDAIDAQIKVLKNRYDDDDVYTDWGENENLEEDEDFCESVFHSALEACMWLHGNRQEKPSAGWGVLVKQ